MFKELFIAFSIFISQQLNYNVDFPEPIVELTSQSNLNSLSGFPNTIALYDIDNKTLLLMDDFDMTNYYHREAYLHELVHYFQHMNGYLEKYNHTTKFRCFEEAEKDAYNIGSLYLKMNNIPEWKDSLFVFMLTECNDKVKYIRR